MLNAIEQGILTESTKQRLQELEQIKKKIEADIAKEKISKPKYTREQYKEFFDKYKTADIKKHEHRKALVNYFVNAVVLYDDDLVFYMNYKNNAFKLPFSKIKQSSDSILNSLPRENRHPHGCLFFSSIEEDKDSKNRYYEAKPSNKVIGTHSKSVIL